MSRWSPARALTCLGDGWRSPFATGCRAALVVAAGLSLAGARLSVETADTGARLSPPGSRCLPIPLFRSAGLHCWKD